MRPPPRNRHPHGDAAASGGGSAPYPRPNYYPQNPNPQFPFNPQVYQQQSYLQNPNLQNVFIRTLLNPQLQNPNFQNLATPAPRLHQNASSSTKISMEMVENVVAKAHGDLITAGENITAWKVSQAALISFKVDSWSSLGFQLQDVPSLRRLLVIEGKINAFIHCFVGAQKITTLHDLEVAICKNEGVERFEKLGLGPLLVHPLAQHYFLIPSDSVDIFKISSEDIIACLHNFMNKSNKPTVSSEELLDFIAEQKSASSKEKLGVRIQSLGLHISYIRQAKKSERTILNKSLEGIKHNRGERVSTETPPGSCTHLEKQMLNKRFDSISDRVKSFSSLCDLSGGKHMRFDYSSNDEYDDSDENVDGENINTGHSQSSHDNTSSRSCPYPSVAEEMIRLGLKSATDEKIFPLKAKLMDFRDSRYSVKKQKRRRKENHDNTMNKYRRSDVTAIDSENKLDDHTQTDVRMKNFITTWREACREHSAAEVLELMINFYMTSTTVKKKRKIQENFSTYPGVGLLHVAVTSIKRGLLDSVYDTVQIFGDHGSAYSTEIIEIEPSVKESSVSNINEYIDGCSYRVMVDDIIKSVAEFFRLHILIPSIGEPSPMKLFEILKKISDCEAWLLDQFSVKEFSLLGYGNFYSFLEQHASQLPNEMCTYLNVKSPEPSRVEICMLQRQLEILLAQMESNLIDKGNTSKSDISYVLEKQFPMSSLHITGDEKCFLDLIKRQKDHNNSCCVLYSISLLGNWLRGDLGYHKKIPSEGSGKETETGRKCYSHGNATSKDAIDCLLKVPMLSDLLSWSHWDAIYASSLGPLSDWLLNELDGKELLCIATVDGKFIRIEHSATVDDFLEAMIQCSPFQVALKLLSLLSLCGGVSNLPLSLLKCYAQRAIDVIIRNSTSSTELMTRREILMSKNAWQGQVIVDKDSIVGSEGCTINESLCGIKKAVVDFSRFILECLEYLPSEFRSFGTDILVSGLRSVSKDAHSIILHECSRTSQRIMLHDIGLSLGITEWIDDFHIFSSSAATDLLISSTTLRTTLLCAGSGETLIHTGDTSEQPVSNDHGTSPNTMADASEAHKSESRDVDNKRGDGPILAGRNRKNEDICDAAGKNCRNSENGMVQDATSIVESIRREEFGLDPNLNITESSILKKQHARLGRALHCLSQELYSQDSHLLLELVQNADDNIYTEDVDPTLVFVLRETGIVVLNNEQGFSAQNIKALCDIGNSTKKGSSAGYIGHKGIGFKSVFRVTDTPEIHSNGFHVKFDITEGEIGFVLPTVIPPCNVDMFRPLLSSEENSSDDTKWNTCIVLPFRSKIKGVAGMASILSMFSDLHPSLLLFLHRLRCIKFMNMLNNNLISMRREILGNGIVKVYHGSETMTWLVISKNLSANLIRSDVQSTEIAVAFTLDECESGEYKPHLSQQPVFAFLPLRNYGMKFILQGDFVLPSSREEVDGNSAWNQWLLSEFPALFVGAEQSFCSLPCFHTCLGKAVTIYMSFVPVAGEVHGFFSHLPQMIISKLRMSNCLLLDGPDLTWVLPCRVLRGWNEQARTLLSDSLLQKHLGLGYLSKDIELSDTLAKALGIQDYGPKVLIEVISSICRFKDGILSLGLDWLSAWLAILHVALSTHSSGYHSLNARNEHDLINYLSKVPFIPLSDNSYGSVAEGPIWLPCDASNVGIEGKYSAAEFPSLYAKLRTVNPLLFSATAKNMYNIEEAKRDNIVHILCKIGVQQLSAHEIIRNHILVALSNVKHMDKDSNLMIEYLSFILLHFQHDCVRCYSEKKDIMSELRKNIVILTNHGYKCPIDNPVHFSKEYKNPVDIDKLLGLVGNDKWHEVDVAYLRHPSIQSLSFGATKWRDFLGELGVTDFVRVTCNRKNVWDATSSSGDVMPDADLNIAASFISDWESSELVDFLSTFSSNKCREKCVYLLEVLDTMWDDFYHAYSRSPIISEANVGEKTVESSFMKSLREFGWIASSMDLDLHQSNNLFYDCVEVRSIFGSLAPYAVPKVTSKLLLKDIGFRTEVTLDDALKVLRFWELSKTPCTASILQMSKLYTFISDELTKSNTKIFEELTSSSFVFVPFLSTFRHNEIVSGVFLSPKELYWDDPTGCADKTKEFLQCPSIKNNDSVGCKALSAIYPGLYDFFLNVCGVPKNPSFGSYLQMLLQLSSIAPPSQASRSVFQVFVKWANDLKSGSVDSGEILNLKENLHKLENTVLPTLLDKWVSLHPSFGLICWSDDDELKQQFKHFDGLDFLDFGELSKEDLEKLSGRIATFLHEIGVPALSEVVSREAVFYGLHDNKEKASVINWVLPYAQRYLCKLYPDVYSHMKQLGIEKLTQLQVVVVEKLFYKNCLRGRASTLKKRFECSCLLQGVTLYTTLTADLHSIFLELSRLFFNGSTELHFANFLHMVTTMAESGSTSEQTEFFILNSQKIPMLPIEEPIWSFSSLTEPLEVESSHPIFASTNVDDNTSKAPGKQGSNSNWPPTGWKTAPDFNYAHANYHLTRPRLPQFAPIDEELNIPLDAILLTEELAIPDELSEKYAVGENSTVATVNNPNLEPSSETKSESNDLISFSRPERDTLCYQTHYVDNQSWKTGRLGEDVAYKFFVSKLGPENVKWVNEGNETGLPYDLIIGVDESSREYIEVKATRSATKNWFEISTREWQFAVEMGDSYSVAHVTLGSQKASVTMFKNPLSLCLQNVLQLALVMPRQVKDPSAAH